MRTLITCPIGHQWESNDLGAPCPYCAAADEFATDNTHIELDASIDELPPPVAAARPTRTKSTVTIPSRNLPRVPGYELLAEVGRGGMGVVYKARDIRLDRVVALKMIRSGADASTTDLARFRIEAEATARLQHPNIVQVFEVGEADGMPYVALEFVEGTSLSKALAGNPLEPRAAAALVKTLAAAMHNAHEHGIVHRDLKPANILISGIGLRTSDTTPQQSQLEVRSAKSEIRNPKITDFGLARRLDMPGHTKTGEILGTPSYMAPEQASGMSLHVGPAADVYALGAVLYECLTGRPPFLASFPAATLLQVLSDEPVTPSRLARGVPRDLETICLKCLQKEPRKRYASALALAEDLERFLAGEPICARRVSGWERLVKWARRRPAVATLVAASTVSFVSLLALGFWSYAEIGQALKDTRKERDNATRQTERAERNFDQARQAVQRLIRTAKDKLGHVPRMETEQRAILQEAVAYYESLPKEEADNPAVRKDMGEAYMLMGNAEERFGNLNRAETYQRLSLKIRQELAAEFPDSADYQYDLSSSYNFTAGLFDQMGRYADAEEMYEPSLRLRAQLASRHPEQLDFARSLGASHYNLGLLMWRVGRNPEAEKHQNQALTIWTDLAQMLPRDPLLLYDLAGVHLNLGAIYHDTGRFLLSEQAYQKALDWREKGAALNEPIAQRPYHRAELSQTYHNLGDVLRIRGKLPDAEKAYRNAVETSRKLTEDYPSVVEFRQRLDRCYASLAQLLVEMGKPADEFKNAAAVEAKSLSSVFEGNADSRGERASLATSWAQRLDAAGKYKEAESAYRRAVELWQELANEFPAIPLFQRNRADALASLAAVEYQLGRRKEAESTLGQAQEVRQKLSHEFPAIPGFALDLIRGYVQLGYLLEKVERWSEAEQAFRQALMLREKLSKAFPREHHHRVNCGHDRIRLAHVLERQGKDPEAMYDQALAEFQRLAADVPDVPDYQSQAAAVYSRRGSLFATRNRPKDAEESYKQARAIRLKLAAAVPESVDYRGLLGDSHFDLGFFLQDQARPKEAEPELTRARDLYAGLHAEFPGTAVYQRHLALACNNLGNALWSNDRPDDAARSFAQARDLQMDLVSKLPQERADRFHLARYFHNLGLLQLNRLRHAEESIASFVEARALLKKLVAELPDDTVYRTFLGEIHGDLGRAYLSRDMLAEAQPCLQEAVAELKKVFKAQPKNSHVAQTLVKQYQNLLQVQVRREEHSAARTTAAELMEVLPEHADSYLAAAGTLAACIPLVQRDARLSHAERDKRIEQLGQQSVAALRQAHNRGHALINKLLESPAFDPLRERSDFKKLRLEIEKEKP